MRSWLRLSWVLGLLSGVASAQENASRIDARLMRQPDVSATQIAFVYAGDIWLVPKTGGVATRVSSPRGEESFPKFSPDGARLAFSANYDGNTDIYVMPVGGGVPLRITHHGASDRLIDWYPDGQSLLFATSMTSYKDRFNQLYRVPATGGLPEKLPMPYGEFGALHPDGHTLAFTPLSVDFRTWKRYRGGMNPDIWVYDLEKHTARNLTHSDAADSVPMWHGDKLYYLSDRDEARRANLWALDVRTGETRAVTKFRDYDVHFPSIGPKEIVFEQGGKLHLLDLATEATREVEVRVVTDLATLKPRVEYASGLVQNATVSPTGKRVLFEARGEIFNAPAEQGVVRNLTRTSGSAERFPAWSPDGRLIAYFSDRTGEYELTVRAADGSGSETNLTRLGPGFRYFPQWAPDSRKLAFIDQAMRVNLYDFDRGTNQVIDHQMWLYHGALWSFSVSWSGDSRWLAYAGDQENRNSAIVLYDVKEAKRYQVTSGFYDDDLPVFDPDGKYLYFRTRRHFSPLYGSLDSTFIYANGDNLAVVPLKADTASPFLPKNDEEEKGREKKDEKKEEKKEPADKKVADVEAKAGGATNRLADATSAGSSTNAPAGSTNQVATTAAEAKPAKKDAGADAKDAKDQPKPVEIDREGFERRALLLPVPAGQYANLVAVGGGKLIYRRLARVGSDGGGSPLLIYDLDKKEEKVVLSYGESAELSADGKKLLVRSGGTWAVVEPKEGQNLNKPVPSGGLEAMIDPVAEWHQIFDDSWRFERDFFYDPGLHGVDWPAMRERYGRLLRDAVTRWDVNYILGELIGELNASHTYRSGGDVDNGPGRSVGYLGCDFTVTNGAYRISRIIEAADWDSEVRSPLRQPGVKISEGDYLLAVNGEPLDAQRDPWAAFQGLGDRPALLLVNTNSTREGAREVLVQCLGSEARLRHLAWIEQNRRRVETATGGRVGYVYVPDTGVNGQNELVRQWRGQVAKDGLIVDERFNSGGQIPDRFVEILNRPLKNSWGVRDGRDWSWPPVAHQGPKVMLINGWSGSGGDCFPYYFKQDGLGPLIGTRTWGGLIGMTGSPVLVDGGSVTVPTFGIYDPHKGEWIIEGHGVDPDIEVIDDPAAMARGVDPQLERAIEEVLKSLQRQPPLRPTKPPYPKRSGV